MSADATSKGYLIVGGVMIVLSLVVVFGFGLPVILGFAPFVVGLGLMATPFVVNGVPALVRSIWNSAEPEWDGEILHTDGGDAKVRYGFDPQGTPWFVAKDVCLAVGEKTPGNRAPNWRGIRLVTRNDLACFSAENVEKYLSPLVTDNRDAARLLTLLQSQVLRKYEREREQKRTQA